MILHANPLPQLINNLILKEMPVKKQKVGGKVGKKFGDKGKSLTGANAESKAKKQGAAIKSSQSSSRKKNPY